MLTLGCVVFILCALLVVMVDSIWLELLLMPEACSVVAITQDGFAQHEQTHHWAHHERHVNWLASLLSSLQVSTSQNKSMAGIYSVPDCTSHQAPH